MAPGRVYQSSRLQFDIVFLRSVVMEVTGFESFLLSIRLHADFYRGVLSSGDGQSRVKIIFRLTE
jgi:hypothetical protein